MLVIGTIVSLSKREKQIHKRRLTRCQYKGLLLHANPELNYRAQLTGQHSNHRGRSTNQHRTTHLRKAHMQGTHLGKAHVLGAHLGEAMLQGTHLGKAHMQGSHLGEAQLQGTHLRKAQL